ncbi:MAG TPA: N-acetylneuraminate synthase family protein [Paracoccaceae bacterium]|nr:N-acetylneuraminate synthase family protein [Paracoccaceae bacterium]
MPTWIEQPCADAPCSVIAEIAQAHDGSLGTAHAMIDAAAEAGVDAVKFQTHIADAESSPAEPWRKRFSPQDETRLDYWRRMEFTEPQWVALRDHAAERGLMFLSSPFSMEAVELLKRVGVAAWKVASGEITNAPMIEAMAATGLPVIVSTGMSDFAEVRDVVSRVKARGVPVAVLQCATSYPTAPEQAGLNMLDEFRRELGVAVGLSDHSATVFPGVVAAYLGAQVIEVHLTLTRRAFGPDVIASLTVEEMAELVRGVRYAEAMRRNPVAKDSIGEGAREMRAIFMKSVVPLRDMAAGEVLAAADLGVRKPGTGIPAGRLDEIVGRRLQRAVARLTPLAENDLVPLE